MIIILLHQYVAGECVTVYSDLLETGSQCWSDRIASGWFGIVTNERSYCFKMLCVTIYWAAFFWPFQTSDIEKKGSSLIEDIHKHLVWNGRTIMGEYTEKSKLDNTFIYPHHQG